MELHSILGLIIGLITGIIATVIFSRIEFNIKAPIYKGLGLFLLLLISIIGLVLFNIYLNLPYGITFYYSIVTLPIYFSFMWFSTRKKREDNIKKIYNKN